VWDVLKPNSECPAAGLNCKLDDLAVEGRAIREALNNWNTNFEQWIKAGSTPLLTSQSLLAKIYFHSISIYLSGIFDYRPQFNHINAPRLAQGVVQNLVDSIISTGLTTLRTTNLGGILLFFPLRVAGARVTSRQEAETIVQMLNEISKRSFVVADAFVTDLEDLWQGKGI
jgi:hypothetical protein